MATRDETAAATRRALIEAAAELLENGGPDAVTLRAVGERAGVSRGAPYGHFPDKQGLLAAVAVESWTSVARHLDELVANGALSQSDRLSAALEYLIELGRRKPYTYALMFGQRHSEATGIVGNAQDQFLSIVAASIDDPVEARATAAMLLASTHGVIAYEAAGNLEWKKWGVTPEQLIQRVIRLSSRA